MTVDERPTGGVEGAVKAGKVMLTARRAHALRATDVDDPVARDAVGGELGRLEALACERVFTG